MEGKILACQYAREHDVPYLGICLGMQVAAIEFARDVCGLEDANSGEFNPGGEHLVIDLMEEQMAVLRKGGTMRLGAQTCSIEPGTLAAAIYGNVVTERHRHRYEANNLYLDQLKKAGLVISALTPTEKLCEIMELPKTGEHAHPWYMGVQYHPEFKSTPRDGHPLFTAFINAALANKEAKAKGNNA